MADIGFDYNIEVKLVKFVEENGEPVSLPYTRKITEGLRPGVNYISAIIAYNAEGRAVAEWASGRPIKPNFRMAISPSGRS